MKVFFAKNGAVDSATYADFSETKKMMETLISMGYTVTAAKSPYVVNVGEGEAFSLTLAARNARYDVIKDRYTEVGEIVSFGTISAVEIAAREYLQSIYGNWRQWRRESSIGKRFRKY